MRKILILFAALLFYIVPLHAQDTIYLKKQKHIEGKVVEVDKDFVKYRKQTNIDGPIYSIHKKYIDSITYANGQTDVLYRARVLTPERILKNKQYDDLKNNLIATGSRVFFTDASNNGDPMFAQYIQYERLMVKDHLGFYISPFIGLDRKAYGAAVAAKYYFKNKRAVRFGVGFQNLFGLMQMTNRFYDYSNSGWPSSSIMRDYEVYFSAFSILTNLQVHFTPKLCLSSELSLGTINETKEKGTTLPDNWKSETGNMTVGFSIGIGYRF